MTQLSDQELQSKILDLAQSGALLYQKGSGGWTPPECFVQCYCAAELIKAGFVVLLEANMKDLFQWHLQENTVIEPDLASGFVDLLIYDPAEDGLADNALLRAIVEFKVSPWHIDDDVRRTTRIVAKVREHPKHFSDTNVFGYIVAGGKMFNTTEAVQLEIKAKEPLLNAGHGSIGLRQFSCDLRGYGQQYGVVIGIAILGTLTTGSSQSDPRLEFNG